MSRSALILPIRGLFGSKTRLASVLSAEQRAVLVGAMAQRVLYLALDAGVADHLYLVTRDSALAAVVDTSDPRVQVLVQPPASAGLNEAIDLGRLAAIGAGVDRLIVLSGDLPLIERSDIEALDASASPVAMVPDGPQVGTNALQLRGAEAIARFPMRFGQESHAAHWSAAKRLGFACTDVVAPGIAFDLDTPEDWAQVPESYRDAVLGRRGHHRIPGTPVLTGSRISVENA